MNPIENLINKQIAIDSNESTESKGSKGIDVGSDDSSTVDTTTDTIDSASIKLESVLGSTFGSDGMGRPKMKVKVKKYGNIKDIFPNNDHGGQIKSKTRRNNSQVYGNTGVQIGGRTYGNNNSW